VSSTASAIQVIEFVRALALAWKNVSSYPPGHPALTTSLDHVTRCLRDLRGPAGEVTLGITADALLYGGHKIEIAAGQRLAEALYTRGVAVVRFAVETDEHDLEMLLRVLSGGSSSARSGQRRPFDEELTAEGVININVQSVRYTSVQVTDTLAEAPPVASQHSVWEDIVRALLENRGFAHSGTEVPHAETADELSKLIAECLAPDESHPIDPDGTFGVRLPRRVEEQPIYRFLEQTVGQQIREATGLKKQHSLDQAVQLIRTLPQPLRQSILRAVVHALAMDASAAVLLRDFAEELPPDEVLDALRYLASIEQMSSHAMTLLDSLSTVEAAGRAEAPSAAVVADLVSLFGDDDPNRFNPAGHRDLLTTIAVHVPEIPPEATTSIERLGLRAESVADTMPQFSATLFALLDDPVTSRSPEAVLTRLESVFLADLRSGQFPNAIAFITHLQAIAMSAAPPLRAAIEKMLAHICVGDVIHTLIENVQTAKPDAAAQIQRLAELLGQSAHHGLLSALAMEDNRSRRRRLFDFLASLGPSIVPEVIPFLQDERWYVVRNMIVLLRALHDRTSVGELRRLAHHPDLRVRLEAIRSLFAFDSSVPAELLRELFNDADPKVAEAAVTIVGNYGIKEAVDPLLQLVSGADVFGTHRMIRIKALRALGEIADERALRGLDRFFKSAFLLWPTKEERYAAWESLGRYPAPARERLVQRGLRSLDPQIRAICASLTRS
jgi:HEAT repeat protein